MTVRFNETEVRAIADAACKHAFASRCEQATNDLMETAVRVIEHEAERKYGRYGLHLYRAAARQEGWLAVVTPIFNLFGQTKSAPRAIPILSYPTYKSRIDITRQHPLAGELEARFDAYEIAWQERTQRLEEVMATLRALKTWKRLEANWPEIIPLIPDHIKLRHTADKPGLPVSLHKLNQVLDLPPGEKENKDAAE